MSTAPRILHVITTVNRGGAENHLFELVRCQAASGMEVAVAFLRNHDRELAAPTHNLALRFYGDPRALWRLRRLISRFGPDLIHAHMPPAELYARLALAGIGARQLPLIVTKHNAEPFFRGPGERAMGRWAARRASAVIAISDAVKRYMAGPALGIPAEKIHTIRYGIDAQPFCEADDAAAAKLRRQWGVPEGALVVGFAGRLVPQKSVETLLRGFAPFARESNARLVILGGGVLDGALRREAEQLGIAGRVTWEGFREDMPAVMRAFDVFALTSLYEGFGLVLAEAMAAARPVIASRVSAMPEVVADGETGLLVPPRDPGAVTDALRVMRDAAARARFGEAGRRRVLSEFTLDKMWEQTGALYSRVLGASRMQEATPCAAFTAS